METLIESFIDFVRVRQLNIALAGVLTLIYLVYQYWGLISTRKEEEEDDDDESRHSVRASRSRSSDHSRPALVQVMVRSEREWEAVTSFCEAIMLAKEVAGRERERISLPSRRGRRPGRRHGPVRSCSRSRPRSNYHDYKISSDKGSRRGRKAHRRCPDCNLCNHSQ